MNERIEEIVNQVDRIRDLYKIGPVHRDAVEHFAELVWEAAYQKGISDKESAMKSESK